MNAVFVKSNLQQQVPKDFSSGVVFGPFRRKNQCGFQYTLDQLLCRPNPPDPLIESIATLAIAVYAADKSFSRSGSVDAWTREIVLSIPVQEQLLPAVPFFTNALRFLSGDIWNIEPRIEPVSIGANRYWQDDFQADSICLFSGGLDSLTGAINLLEEGRTLVLVSHFESGAVANIQKNLANNLIRHYGFNRVRHRTIQVCAPVSNETSTRARSFLFIALGLMTASVFGSETPLYIPENGFIGLNIPLAGSRQGSYSTRTTHPAYLSNFRHGLSAIECKHEIINPFLFLSKAEVLSSCKNQTLLKKLLPQTLSCAKAGMLRWDKKSPQQNCGFCYPCLVRRSATFTLVENDEKDYAFDAIGSELILQSEGKGRDLRCFLQAAARYKHSKRSLLFEVLKTGSIMDINDNEFSKITHPIKYEFENFISLVEQKGCEKVKRYLSI